MTGSRSFSPTNYFSPNTFKYRPRQEVTPWGGTVAGGGGEYQLPRGYLSPVSCSAIISINVVVGLIVLSVLGLANGYKELTPKQVGPAGAGGAAGQPVFTGLSL